jgi:hypothetical protein
MTTEPTPADSTSTSVTEKPAPAPPPVAPSVETPPALAPAPPGPPQAAPTWPMKADIAILGLLLILSFFLASFAATNSDLWLNLAIGKRISEGEFEFGVDPYSWATEATLTRPAVYWVHHSWLYSWLVFQLYSCAGGTGLVIGKAILFTAAIALLSRIGFMAFDSSRGPAGLNDTRLAAHATKSRSEASRWFGLIFLVMAALAASNLILLRPIVVSLLFLSITLFVLDHAGIFALKKDEAALERARWLWYLPPLFALWANLDHWFILGPLLLALCWGGTGLAKWYPSGNPVPGRTIGAVLGLGVAACILNPHHVHVFELPPELAYVVLSISDPCHIPLPDSLIGAGRTIKEIAKIEPNFTLAGSSLSSSYWQNPTVAGLAFYPLLVLGLIAFTLVALVKPQPNAPTLQVSRFLPWLFFAVLALALYRMIPFFVVIAAPLTALTLGEFLQWQQTSNAVPAGRRDRGLNLARLVSLPFMLLLLYLAWPGWLHGTGGANDYAAPRRVAWEIRPEASFKRAAESLRELKKQGQCHNVFNTSIDFGNCMPWFAPDVKYFMDTRFSLYTGQAAAYDKARRALTDASVPAADWQTLFQERDIDQVAIMNLLAGGRVVKYWFAADQWRQRYADQRMMVFSWAGRDKRWESESADDDWNRQAFGTVAPAKRPPATGVAPPQTPGLWMLYLEGVGRPAAAVGEFNVQQTYYQLKRELHAGSRYGFIFFCATLTNGAMSLPPSLAVLLNEFKPRDLGPPALPILMVRTARLAVAENPLDPDSHRALLIANEALRNVQEDFWAQRQARAPHPSALRDRLRQTQLLASAYNLARLQPDNPDNHHNLADLYAMQNQLDLALAHRQLALKALEKLLTSGKNAPKNPKDRDAALKNYHDKNIKRLEDSVRGRLADFKENSGNLKPLDKVIYARNKLFKEFGEKGVEESLLGLAQKAWDVLTEIDQNSLTKEDLHKYLLIRFDLALSMGRVEILADDLKHEGVRAAVPAPIQLLAAGALGDYQAMDEALALIEQQQREGLRRLGEDIKRQRTRCAPSMVLAPTQPFPAGLIAGLTNVAHTLVFERIAVSNAHYDLFNAMTLRGIVALEAGETEHARDLFQATLNEAGSEHFFSDRPIARRYLDLLNQQRDAK